MCIAKEKKKLINERPKLRNVLVVRKMLYVKIDWSLAYKRTNRLHKSYGMFEKLIPTL